MRILDNKKEKIIILEDGDILKVKTLKRNPLTLKIECKDGCILVDELLINKIKEIKREQKELEKIKLFNKKNQ